MRRWMIPLLSIVLLLWTTLAMAAPPMQPPTGTAVVVSNAGQSTDPWDWVDLLYWRPGNDLTDPSPNWREPDPDFNLTNWYNAWPAWRDQTWTNFGPLDPVGPSTGPDHIWYTMRPNLTPDVGNGRQFATRQDGASYDNGYQVPPPPHVLFARKEFCLPLNAVPHSPAGQLQIMAVDEYVVWMNGPNQIGLGSWPPAGTYDTFQLHGLIPVYPGHNVLAIRARNLQADQLPEIGGAVIYRLSIDYDIDPNVITIAGPTEVIVGQPLTLDGQVNGNPGYAPYIYDWDLGDGGTASGQSVAHTYAAPGTYTVQLTVTDTYGNGQGCTGITTLPITVHDAPPLSISKADNPDPVVEGGLLDYTLTAHNGGTIEAANAVVSDTVPAGTTYVGCAGAPCSEAGGVVTWTGLAIPAGGDANVSFQVQVGTGLTVILNDGYGVRADGAIPAQGLPITTTVVPPTPTPTATPTETPLPATPTFTPSPTDVPPTPTMTPTATLPPASPTSTPSPTSIPPTAAPRTPAPTLPPGSPQLTLTHSVSPTVAAPGDTVTYQTVIQNIGPVTAKNVILGVDLPGAVQPGSYWVDPAAASFNWTSSHHLDTTWPALDPGDKLALNITAIVREGASGEAVSTARIAAYWLEDQAILQIPLLILPAAGTPSSALPAWSWLLALAGLVGIGLGLRKWVLSPKYEKGEH